LLHCVQSDCQRSAQPTGDPKKTGRLRGLESRIGASIRALSRGTARTRNFWELKELLWKGGTQPACLLLSFVAVSQSNKPRRPWQGAFEDFVSITPTPAFCSACDDARSSLPKSGAGPQVRVRASDPHAQPKYRDELPEIGHCRRPGHCLQSAARGHTCFDYVSTNRANTGPFGLAGTVNRGPSSERPSGEIHTT